ncbi:fungal specific transcription factor domain-containing protein [Sarocladium implicatum]|nr:fungal specific transcription factor domain-containing protein [Sarocladium implicatum]
MVERKIEKRNRPPVSCNPCRGRKLKCNRGLPCDTCVRRGKTDICQYAPNADRSKAEVKKAPVAEQLKKLEEMIFMLAEQKTKLSPKSMSVSASDKPSVSESPELHTEVAPNQLEYTEPNHWLSIIEDIKDIREQLSPGNQSQDTRDGEVSSSGLTQTEDSIVATPGSSADLNLRHIDVGSLSEVLDKGLPPKHLCDFWVSLYFQARYPTLPLLHPGKFQEEYEAFWEDHKNASPIWIALLFAILSLASGASHVPDLGVAPTAPLPTIHDLSFRTEQCLIIGNYTNGGKYVMETLVLHLQSFYLSGKNANRDVWFAAGVIIRLALRMGYHRDPSTQRSLAHLSEYDCEMRRRLWIIIYQLDSLISFQVGLPSMIPVSAVDVKPPRNLELSYLDPNTQTLPQPRPLTDHTSATYTIAKQPIIEAFRKIVTHTQSLSPRPYEETLELDTQLRDAYNGLPDILKARSINRSLVDGTGLVIQCMTLEFLFLKSTMILHRQHLAHRGNAVTAQSHQTCLRAALTMLQRLEELNQAMKPGGVLFNDKWLIATFNTGDMIFASVIVCLDLTIRVTTPPCACHSGVYGMPTDSVVTLDTGLEAVKKAQKIWTAWGEKSGEAKLAAGALEATIQRVTEALQNEQPPSDALQTVTFDDSVPSFGTEGSDNFEMIPDGFHWEYIDQWMPDNEEPMPDLAAWVLNGVA